MSLGDHLRFLRAMQGGVDTATIAGAIEIDRPWPINEIEVRYRQVGDDDLVAKLATYYDRPVDELLWHRERSRKKFTQFVHRAMQEEQTVNLHLRSGEVLQGIPQWWDLGAVSLLPDEGRELLVVQRHAVIDWD
jgi:sRNA-binding regulator protein Hfq